jgi:membrane associated rhomboid family serine protease
MAPPEHNHLSPWVGRLMAVQAGVMVLLLTVFTAPQFRTALEFDPATALSRPWTIVTHLFVHPGPLSLALTLLVLWLFGPGVERRLGGRRFLWLCLSCGVGAALFGAGLHGFTELPPLQGAGGAVLGVALVFALLWPDSEVAVFPFPVPLSAATVLAIVVVLDLLAAFRFADSGVAHLAHLGGLVTGYAWFRFRRLGPQPATAANRGTLRPVMATQLPYRLEERAKVAPPPPPPTRLETARATADFERAEMDRVLDKIGSSGIASLTPAEKRFLEDMAERKKGA